MMPPEAREPALQAFARSRSPFAQLIAEPDLITLVLPEPEWQSLAAGFPPALAEAPFRVITFDLDLPADLVGFLAAVSAALAEAQVPILAICGYAKDHLMVRERHLPAALAALERLGSLETVSRTTHEDTRASSVVHTTRLSLLVTLVKRATHLCV
jgi:hypothetical protein